MGGGAHIPGSRRRAGARAGTAIAFALLLALPGTGATAAPPRISGATAPDAVPPVGPALALTDGRLRAAVDAMGHHRAAGEGIATDGDRIQVEVLYTGDRDAALAAVKDAGGEVTGEAGTSLIEAFVPYGQLVALEHRPGIGSVRVPLDANAPLSMDPAAPHGLAPLDVASGQEIAKTNAAAWQAAGYKGGGVKVGIVDFFDLDAWNAAKAAGEVPTPAGTFCRQNGSPCDLFTAGADHGEGVAEIIHEMAPQAQIYIATAVSTADLQAAVNYFGQQGVQIVSRSLTAEYDGAGDGSGPIGQIVDSAVSQGMAWFNAAGNSAGSGPNPGSYWRGPWSDTDADNWLEWAPGDELMALPCFGGGRFINGLRWSDWGANRTNYDLYLFDDPAGTTQLSSGTNNQTGGALPLEYVTSTCSNTDYLAVRLVNAGSGTAGDTLEFQVNGTGLEHWSNPSSAAVPAADSANAGALAIGAIDPATGVAIAPYSSWGPTNDNRIKPDISAASCVTSFTYASTCFNGTSAATPVAAGAAAIVRSSGLADTPAELKSYLLTSAFVDRGTAGTDNTYGVGELVLPAPPSANTPPTISDVGDHSTPQDTATGPIGFTVGDAQTGASSLVVSGSSSNTTLVPGGGIAFGGSGTGRTVTLTPAAGQSGSTTITINVSDGTFTTHDTFILSVVAAGCADDGREPDDSIGAAQPVTRGVPVDGTACDDDYSALAVVAGQTINASLAFTDADGNLDLRLYGPSGTQLGLSAGTGDTEHIAYGPASAGTYFVRVYPSGSAANHNDYTLTVTAADVTRPTWTGRSPGSGARGVARDAHPYLVFSEPLNPSTVTASTVRLRDTTAGRYVSATVTYDAGTRRATLRPSSLLAAGHHFRVSAGPGIHDLAGLAFGGVSWTFTATSDRKRPTVSARSPKAAATGASRTASIRITFAEAMRAWTLTTSSVRLRDSTTGAILAATVRYDTRTHRATLNPTAKLAARHAYRVLLSSAIRDRAGNTLRATGWSFKTGS
ncbi:MAG TPA: Ig-like domain-containing protein [Candidatus Limnocylindrales bacterium]|jgi:hypothetical protein